jgi:integrase
MSLKTKVLSVAKQRLRDEMGLLQEHAESSSAVGQGKMRFADAVAIYRDRLQANPSIKPRTKDYYREVLEALLREWPSLGRTNVRHITVSACRDWAAKFFSKYSAHRANNTLAVLREILDIAIEAGACHANPARKVKRAKIPPKVVDLPTRQQFRQLIAEMRRVRSRDSQNCADFIEFLAYSGCRISEARNVQWKDVDLIKGQLAVRGDSLTRTKNSRVRNVPIGTDLRILLTRMRADRLDEPINSAVLRVREAQKAVDRAAAKIGVPRLTHHRFRDVFATTAIECGIDVPTVSRWLGHRDGGALLMQVYGHIRDDHGQAVVEKLNFDAPR